MPRRLGSEKRDLILKSRESALSAVQIYNNPLTTFKTESFIVLFMIAWTYLLHAFFRGERIDYRYYTIPNKRKKYLRNPDGSIKYWDLTECIAHASCPLDKDTVNNLKFLIGLRNRIVHKKASVLDSYLSARYQACALNYNFYVKRLFGERYSLDSSLALSLQFAELDYGQAQALKDKAGLISAEIQSYIADFDNGLAEEDLESERFAYRLLFTKIIAKRKGQADRVIEFLDPKSPLAENIAREYWVIQEAEKPKYRPTDVVEQVRARGFTKFTIPKHTDFWKAHDAKADGKGYGVKIAKTWYWYQNWIEFVVVSLAVRGVSPKKSLVGRAHVNVQCETWRWGNARANKLRCGWRRQSCRCRPAIRSTPA